MAQLFLSYSRKDRECAELLANALSRRGWTVWWDRRIQIGRSFSEVIEYELDQALCIIVIWSREAVASEWVQNEAGDAVRRKILVPIRIEDVRPPLEFRRLQAADLFDWRNGFEGPDFDRCLASIELLVQKTASGKPSAPVDDSEAPVPPPLATNLAQADTKKVETLPIPAAADVAHASPQRPAPSHTPAFAPPASSEESHEALPPTQSPHQTARTEFWVSQDGQKFCAPDAATLRRWADEGRVRPDSYVYGPVLQRWIRAREISELQGAYQTGLPEGGTRPAAKYRWPLIVAGAGIILLIIILSTLHPSDPGATDTTETAVAGSQPVVTTETSSTGTTETASVDAAGMIATTTSGTDSTTTSETTSTTTSGTSTTATSPTVAISIENRCAKETISVAVCYLNTENQWISAGWWKVEPQKTMLSNIAAIGPNVYFYAYGDTSTWHGEPNDPLTRLLPIRQPDKFGAPVGELKGDGVKSMPFLARAIVAGQSEYTQIFTCP